MPSRSDRSSTEHTTPPSSAHVQPDDVPRTPIHLSVKGEFRQHDGVVMMMMFYRRWALPKHRYDIIEVDYGGGGHRTRLKDQWSIVVSFGCPPAPVYKGARGRGGRPGEGRARRSPTPTGSRTPSLPCWIRRRGKEEGERKERGGVSPSPCPIQTRGEGRTALPWPPLLFSTMAHYGPLSPRGVPVTSRYSSKCPNSPGTISMSKHTHPMYRSLHLDHFETHLHARDHIRDSEQP